MEQKRSPIKALNRLWLSQSDIQPKSYYHRSVFLWLLLILQFDPPISENGTDHTGISASNLLTYNKRSRTPHTPGTVITKPDDIT